MDEIKTGISEETKLILTPTSAEIQGPSLNIFDLIQLTFSAMFNFMMQTLEACPEEAKEITKEQIYDYVNISATNVLEQFAPEYELRPDLEMQAIIQKEEEILKAKVDAMSPEEKAAAQKMVDAYRANLKENLPEIRKKREEAEAAMKEASIEPPIKGDNNTAEDDARALSTKE